MKTYAVVNQRKPKEFTFLAQVSYKETKEVTVIALDEIEAQWQVRRMFASAWHRDGIARPLHWSEVRRVGSKIQHFVK